jgi:ubiquinone/menaquinone biosynthesis C-methylase UbiE
VTCAFAIFFLPVPESALREFHRVLRPGGTVALSSWGPTDDACYEWYEAGAPTLDELALFG